MQPVESPSGPLPQHTFPFPRSFPSLFFLMEPFCYGGCGDIMIILFYLRFRVDRFSVMLPITPLSELSKPLSEVSSGELELLYFYIDLTADRSPKLDIPAAVELSNSLLLLAGVFIYFSFFPSFKVLLLPLSAGASPMPAYFILVLVSPPPPPVAFPAAIT
jgi:hypothetical protein